VRGGGAGGGGGHEQCEQMHWQRNEDRFAETHWFSRLVCFSHGNRNNGIKRYADFEKKKKVSKCSSNTWIACAARHTAQTATANTTHDITCRVSM
jgi:hypothetical protein